MTNSNLIQNVDKYTHGVRMGFTLTATMVHLDTVVPSMSRCQDKYTLALSRVAVRIECRVAARGSGAGGATDTSLWKLHDPGG